ncbi:MAG: aspartate aminotransferase family protein [Gemmatimonadales bacterium]|nr:aspartate aminotransferase family protein [Gemmatimonadales bacterium]
MDAQTVRAKHKEFLFPCVANYYAEPVVITEAHGATVTDADGRDYLDFFGGILTLGIGHSHPEFVTRIQDQVARLSHTASVYPTREQSRVAERLAQITPGKLKKSFFTTSGTEADETAIMLAKIYTGQQEIIALRHAYAGRSMTAIAITGQQPWRVLPTQIAGIKHALSPYCYRCPMGLEYPSCGIRCAEDIEDLIKTETTGRPAAFIAEPIQGAGGFITPPQEYFEIAVGIVRKYGGLFICDEVQTGWGRTGDHWCGIEHWNVEPDIMTFAKSIASGFPVGATIATEDVANAFTGLSLSTFGGNPISMAAVDVTMDVMQREDTPTRSAERGTQLRDALEEFKRRFAFIGDVRGMGLMQALELVEDRKTKEPSPKKTLALMEAAKRHGLLIGKGGLYGNVIRIAPSMLVTKSEVQDGCKRLERALGEVR